MMEEDAARNIQPAENVAKKKRKPKTPKFLGAKKELEKVQKQWTGEYEHLFSKMEQNIVDVAFKALIVRQCYKNAKQPVKTKLRQNLCSTVHNWMLSGSRVIGRNFTTKLIDLKKSFMTPYSNAANPPSSLSPSRSLETAQVLKRCMKMQSSFVRTKRYCENQKEGSFYKKHDLWKDCYQMSLYEFETHLNAFRKVFEKDAGQGEQAGNANQVYDIQLREKMYRESEQNIYQPTPEITAPINNFEYRPENYQILASQSYIPPQTSNFIYQQPQAAYYYPANYQYDAQSLTNSGSINYQSFPDFNY